MSEEAPTTQPLNWNDLQDVHGLDDLRTLTQKLQEVGYTAQARCVVLARQALDQALSDESDTAPDWEPLLDTMRREECRGLRLLGRPVPPAWNALYPTGTVTAREARDVLLAALEDTGREPPA